MDCKVFEYTEYRMHFCCKCGCEFWVNQNAVKEHRVRSAGFSTMYYYFEAECPKCKNIVYSAELPVRIEE